MKYKPPTVDGVSPSALALPGGSWPLLLDYLAHRLPTVPREQWAQRMAKGDVLDEQGQAFLARFGGRRVLLSLSHTDALAMAVAVIVA